ncbi:mCG1026162, partial [Mus musculus]
KPGSRASRPCHSSYFSLLYSPPSPYAIVNTCYLFWFLLWSETSFFLSDGKFLCKGVT